MTLNFADAKESQQRDSFVQGPPEVGRASISTTSTSSSKHLLSILELLHSKANTLKPFITKLKADNHEHFRILMKVMKQEQCFKLTKILKDTARQGYLIGNA